MALRLQPKDDTIKEDSIANEMANKISMDNIRLVKSGILGLLFSIGFLVLGVIWFFSFMVIATDIGTLLGQRFDSPLPYYLHPAAWAFAVIGWVFMEMVNPKATGRR